jgi:hypothetical protein
MLLVLPQLLSPLLIQNQRLNCHFHFKNGASMALHKSGLNTESVHHVELIYVYDVIMCVVEPLMGWRKCDISTAGVDGKRIIPTVNAGALFTTFLIYHDRITKHIFTKNKQVAAECPEGCKHSFILPLSLFSTRVPGTPVVFFPLAHY